MSRTPEHRYGKQGGYGSSLNIRRELSKRFGWRCWYCGIKLVTDGGQLDHILPRCRGGSNDGKNLALVCSCCNYAKRDMLLDEYLDWLEYVRSGGSYTPYNLSPIEVETAEYNRKFQDSPARLFHK